MADKRHTYSIRLDWTGNQRTGTSAYRAYSRAHEISAQGKTAITGSSDPVFRGDAARWNRKAYTARAFSQPSADFVKRLQDRPDTVGSRHYSRVLALAGGLPIKVGDEVVGAVGVSGTPGKDDDCSQAGINKVADQLK
jgi:uncharacterized protein GlcG (DUF336 family)